MKNGRNYALGILVSIILCAVCGTGMFMLPAVADTMSILTVIFMFTFSLFCSKWMGLKYEN